MSRSSVLDHFEDEGKPAKAEPWAWRIVLALILSLAAHAAFLWWARSYAVNTFSESYYDQIVPRAFKVDRVEIDSSLLDETPEPTALEAGRNITPVPVDLPAEEIVTAKPEVKVASDKPAELSIGAEDIPQISTSASDATAALAAATAESLDEDLSSMREALLADRSSSSSQPALELAESAGRAGRGAVDAVPAGYSNLDELLSGTGGISESQAPIFMPSDVLFGYNESFLGPGAISSLEKLGELIRRNPQSRFRIEGHTDSFGGPGYNAQLSLDRADSVKQWLVSRMSIEPDRIDTRGLGSTRPLVPTTGSIEEQQLNRRVEIVILRADGGR